MQPMIQSYYWVLDLYQHLSYHLRFHKGFCVERFIVLYNPRAWTYELRSVKGLIKEIRGKSDFCHHDIRMIRRTLIHVDTRITNILSKIIRFWWHMTRIYLSSDTPYIQKKRKKKKLNMLMLLLNKQHIWAKKKYHS